MGSKKLQGGFPSSILQARKCTTAIHDTEVVMYNVRAVYNYYLGYLDVILPDINEKHTLFLENSVLNHWPDYTDVKADVTVTVDRTTLTKVLTKQVSFKDAVKTGQV
jgi:alkyl sulfatase BDS1-like metallo-beta-lactamase superfamily hydrolase